MSQSRALIVANRRARKGRQSLAAAIEHLDRAGIETVSLPEDASADLAQVIRAHADRVSLVVLAGGDGTLNHAAAALHETGLPFGVLPMGTANDFARTIGVPRDLTRAAQIIIDGHLRAVDLGEVNGHFFFNVASIGFSAALARELTAEAKKRWGTLGYAFAALNLLRQSRPFTVEIDHDGTIETVKTAQVAVGNGRFYGGGMAVERTAAPDDGRLDVYSLEIDHWWELLALAPWLRRGTQKSWRKVRAFSATNLTIRTRRPHDINADGEIVGQTPATFHIKCKAVKVFAPSAGSAAR
ncbi:MAG: lipid kinase [Parvibaculaceae bacterium]